MRGRLILLVVATSSLVLVGFLVPLAMLVRDTAADRAVGATSMEIQAMAPIVAAADTAALATAVDQANHTAAHPVTVFLPDGTVVGVPAPRSAAVDEAATGRSITADAPGGREILVAVAGRADGTAVVRAYVTDAELSDGVARAWLTLGLLGCGVLLVSIAVADRLARTMTRPLVSVAGLAERLATGDLSARADPGGPREVRRVAASLNRLAGRIGDLLANERESAADLSHRLRTPLTALRIDVEGLRDPAERARITGDVEALEIAVDEIIRLARRPPVPTSACDATAVVRERAEFWSALAEEEQRPFTVSLPPGPAVVGVDADSLSVCVDALLGNVFAHTPEGTAFRVTLTHRGQPGGARLTVADDGPGLDPAYALRRGASGAGSTGLGLDIVRRTATAAGGSLRVDDGQPGATVIMELGPSIAAQLRRDLRNRAPRQAGDPSAVREAGGPPGPGAGHPANQAAAHEAPGPPPTAN